MNLLSRMKGKDDPQSILPIDAELELRLLEKRHAALLLSLVDSCRGYLRNWLPWVDNTQSIADMKAFIHATRRQHEENQGFAAGIFYRDHLVGVISYHPIDWSNRSVAIGYWLAQGSQGYGIMTRACRRFIDHAFTELNLNRVEIRAGVHNAKSRAIPERLGFVNEGIVRQAEWLYDHYIDLVVYGMLESEWRNRF